MVDVLAKVLAVPATHLDTMALWAVHTHLLQRRELGHPALAPIGVPKPLEDTGKTTAMMALLYLVARAMATSSLSGASLFRETDAHHWTVLWDEADGTFHKNTNPELEGVFNSGHDRRTARVHRQVPAADGGYETQTFDTFTAIALTMINEFLKKSQQSRCIVLRMKRATQAEAARLEEFDETHEAALLECGRKLVRWAADLDELPDDRQSAWPDQSILVELEIVATNRQACRTGVAGARSRSGQGGHGPRDRREGRQSRLRPARRHLASACGGQIQSTPHASLTI